MAQTPRSSPAGSEDVSKTLNLLSDTRPVGVFLAQTPHSLPAGSEDVSETLNLLFDTRPMREFVAQTLKPLADRNGQGGAAQYGRQGNIDEMSHAQAKQELAEVRNTIAQLGKNQSPFKPQRREGWSNCRECGTDSHGHEQQGALENDRSGGGWSRTQASCITSKESPSQDA
jgi:hypothetical protein